ncbi:hypothetical protein [Streptomyces sp. NPDC007346]|uniref:hypothetical protein n=1 Tax=Streptomyces sp. NPDC007346 TaxID=3154682 RepID=UPI0034523864
MNLFLDYLTVTALFALVAFPSAVGFVHEHRIDRQLRAAERGEVPPGGAGSAALSARATGRLDAGSWAKV